MAIKTNDVKKGWQVKFFAGWIFEVMDNRRGNLRMVRALPDQGLFQDTGDDYVFRWALARENDHSPWQFVEFTDAQKKFEARVKAMGA